jgi:hypothetical protein
MPGSKTETFGAPQTRTDAMQKGETKACQKGHWKMKMAHSTETR